MPLKWTLCTFRCNSNYEYFSPIFFLNDYKRTPKPDSSLLLQKTQLRRVEMAIGPQEEQRAAHTATLWAKKFACLGTKAASQTKHEDSSIDLASFTFSSTSQS